ncbi:phosphopantetheine-binding protein [Longispora sp. K20-0274]|uniref:phosphopantetheine-binding protein n=1 Tax=Longispora sp. K20-0274 TaxID=3088255 RepID=UPI00399BA1B2
MDTNQHRSPAEVARTVEAIWNDVLDAPADSRNATFFELNGQSISAVRIVARIEEELGVPVDMGDLFEDPDLETFVRDVVAKAESLATAETR